MMAASPAAATAPRCMKTTSKTVANGSVPKGNMRGGRSCTNSSSSAAASLRPSSSGRRGVTTMMPPTRALTQGSVLGTTYVARESTKNGLMDALPEEGRSFLAGASSSHERETIADLIVQLEQLNPTEAPAYTTLDGTWEVVWSGGLSPALIAAQALLRVPTSEFKSLVLEIGSKSTLVVSTAVLSIAGQLDVRLTLRSRVGAESGVRLREQYELTVGLHKL
jgi:hypothetical protein